MSASRSGHRYLLDHGHAGGYGDAQDALVFPLSEDLVRLMAGGERCCDQFPWCRCPIVVSEEEGRLLRQPPASLKITVPMIKVDGEWVRDDSQTAPPGDTGRHR